MLAQRPLFTLVSTPPLTCQRESRKWARNEGSIDARARHDRPLDWRFTLL